MNRKPDIRILDDFPADAARFLTDWVKEQLSERDALHVALTGGNTPVPVYETLTRLPYRDHVDWSAIHFYMGDERPVPLDDEESNWSMATRTLLDPLGIAEDRRHPMRGDHNNLGRSAKAYADEIRRHVPSSNGIPSFDLIFLGLGADGHTASLFPCTAALEETRRLVVANPVPTLDTTRLTFTYPLINNARHVVFLVSGATKTAIVQRVLVADDTTLPAAHVRPTQGRSTWLLDREAAPPAE